MVGRTRRLGVALGVVGMTAALAAPTVASAGLVDDLVGNVQDTVNSTVNGVLGSAGGSTGSPGSASPSAAPTPAPAAPAPVPQDATTEPELDGDNPHAEGAVVDTTIENPLGDPIGVTVGQSRGDQDAASGEYSGVVNILVLDNLPLIGDQSIGVETAEGETAESPIGAINNLLNQVCAAGDVCLALLDYRSKTTKNGSKNRFSAARANVLDDTVSAEVVRSRGDISDDGECQTASGSSQAADVGVFGAITAEALESSSESVACADGSQSATGDSEVIDLGALQALDPLGLIGCDPTAVDDEFELPLLVSGVCNGDDTNGAQADAPYNTRTAIQIDLVEDLLGILGADVDLDGSPSESLAVAPEGGDECPDPTNPDCPPTCPDPTNPDCPPIDECPDPTNPDCPNPPDRHDPRDPHDPRGPGDRRGPSASSPEGDSLPFTGADLGTLGLIGAVVMGSGLGLMALADRRRRRAS